MKKFILAIAFAGTLLLASCGSNETASTAPSSDTAAADSMGDMAQGKMDGDMAGMDHSQMEGMASKASDDIHLVSPEAQELPMGDAELVVHFTQDGLTADDVRVEVSMPMEGDEPMTAMAIVEPGDEDNQFKVKTNFGMAGPWTVHVMAKDSDPATFAFAVQ